MGLFKGVATEKEGVRVDFVGRSMKGEGGRSSVRRTEEDAREFNYRLRIHHGELTGACCMEYGVY